MQLKIDDDLAARYDRMAEEYHLPLATVIERQLARFADFPPTVRVVPLTGGPLQQVEKLLGGGQITSGAALEARVRAYASITMGAITLDLSVAQKEEITYRAQKRGVSPDTIAKEMLSTVVDTYFDAVTPYR